MIKTIIKNVLAFLISGVLSMLITGLYLINPVSKVFSNKEAGLASIALIPVLIVYIAFLGIIGGFMGVVIYNVRKYLKRVK